jgi:hypothetical protein
MKNLLDKKSVFLVIFVAILIGAVFLRTYHFHDWLFFKWDQARDAFLISEAVEKGPLELPLLGPRATKVGSSDYLRLGPAYYYLQYTSGAIFDSIEPPVFAYPDLLFSILVIPLLYLFSRLYFSKKISLATTTLYAFSFLVIQYSRFSWNPNAVPFFMLLSFYGLIRLLKEKNDLKKIAWTALWSFGFAVASQLHFFAAFAMTATFGFFFFICFKLYDPKKWADQIKRAFSVNFLKITLAFLVVFGVVYTPMIISDIKTNGENTRLFFGAFSEKPSDRPLGAKIVRNIREHTQNFYLLTTSFRGTKNEPFPIAIGAIVGIIGLASIINELKRSRSQLDRVFPLLMLTWLAAFFFITISVSYQLRPRYFIPIFPLMFLFFAFFWKAIFCKFTAKPKLSKKIFIITFGGVLFLNAYGTYAWFEEQKLSQEKSLSIERTLILKKRDGITLAQFEKVAQFILAYGKTKERVTYQTAAEYRPPLEYLIHISDQPNEEKFVAFGSAPDLLGVDKVLIIETVQGGFNSVDKEIRKYIEDEPEEKFQFGQVYVFIVRVDKEKLKDIEPKKKRENVETRLFWKDII